MSDGIEVGVYRLEEIFKEVRALRIEDGDVLREKLLRKVKVHNWMPEDKKDEFAAAILEAYKNFCEKADLR